MLKKMKLGIGLLSLILLLVACGNITGKTNEDTGSSSDTVSENEGSAENQEEATKNDEEDKISTGDGVTTKPISEMKVEDLASYFVDLGLMEKSEGVELCCTETTATKAILYENEVIEIYWYDLDNLDPLLEEQYNSALENGYITITGQNNIQIGVVANGPFAISADHSPIREEILKAFEELE